MKHLLILLLTTISISGYASNIDRGFDFLSKKEIRSILGEYPALGTANGLSDLDTLIEYQNTRTDEDCRVAADEDKVSLKNLFVKNGGPLSEKEAKKLKWKMIPVYVEAGINIWKAKRLYKRPRPYDSHSVLNPCIPKESSYAYPSGHTTLGRVLGRTLSEIYPERAALFMRRADAISKNRIIGGVHYPTDVAAGKILGDEIADIVVKSKFFQKLQEDLR
jgi:acid phosphatase (class A)